jgi:hypothetical protein
VFFYELFAQPSDYINAILVPRDGQIPVDTDVLASQGIFHVVCSPLSYVGQIAPHTAFASTSVMNIPEIFINL